MASKFEMPMAIRMRPFLRSRKISTPASNRKAEAISSVGADGNSCSGARQTEKQSDRLEAGHRPAGSVVQGATEELQWHALRWKWRCSIKSASQAISSLGIQTPDSRTSRQPDIDLLQLMYLSG